MMNEHLELCVCVLLAWAATSHVTQPVLAGVE